MLPTDTDKAASADKAVADHKAATGAATSVAEAVKHVADAAVAAVQKTQSVPAQDFVFAAQLGGGFTIRGKGFSTNGTVKINGQQATTTEWGNAFIAGKMPGGVAAGSTAVEVAIDDKIAQKGTFKL